MRVTRSLWGWPDGLVWRMTRGISLRSRRKKYALFLKDCQPTPATTILDVGVGALADEGERGENFLEAWYPHPERITALGIGDLSSVQRSNPKVTVVTYDGGRFPFPDRAFDIVFSNAVLEHVGNATAQRAWVAECCRVGRTVFLTTPAREFPVDSHTLIPFAHYLPLRARNAIYRALGRRNEAAPGALTLLTRRALRRCFPAGVTVHLRSTYLLGFPATHIARTE